MRRKPATWIACAAGLADAAVAATAHPFTATADVTTALAIAGLVALGISGRAGASGAGAAADPPSFRAIVGWVGMVAAIVAYELVEYFLSPRSTHPTISSMLSLLDGHTVLRGLVFLAWLALGGWLSAGSLAPRPREPSA
ncbi:MAG: hypothetical protein ACRD0Z_16475 [Acidimicrobiales bacterium]